MKLEITEKKDNPLLSRIDIKASLEYEATTPSNDQVKSEIAKKLSVDPSLIVMKQIKTYYGFRKADVIACAYSKKEELLKIERIKEEPKKESPKEPEKKEAPKQEAKESGKEEKKA